MEEIMCFMENFSCSHSNRLDFSYDIPRDLPFAATLTEIALPLIHLALPIAKPLTIISNALRFVKISTLLSQNLTPLEKTVSEKSLFYRCFNQKSPLNWSISLVNFTINLHPSYTDLGSKIRIIQEIFLSTCDFLEKITPLVQTSKLTSEAAKKTAIQVRSPSLKKHSITWFLKLIEQVAFLSFLTFSSANSKTIGWTLVALNSGCSVLTQWDYSKQPLKKALHFTIALIKSYHAFTIIFPPADRDGDWSLNLHQNKNPFFDALFLKEVEETADFEQNEILNDYIVV